MDGVFHSQLDRGWLVAIDTGQTGPLGRHGDFLERLGVRVTSPEITHRLACHKPADHAIERFGNDDRHSSICMSAEEFFEHALHAFARLFQ